MIDPFSDYYLDSANVLSRIGPSLRQHLSMEGGKSKLVVFAILVHICPASVGFS